MREIHKPVVFEKVCLFLLKIIINYRSPKLANITILYNFIHQRNESKILQHHYYTQQHSFTIAACSSIALGQMRMNRLMLDSVVAGTAQTEVCLTLTDRKTMSK